MFCFTFVFLSVTDYFHAIVTLMMLRKNWLE